MRLLLEVHCRNPSQSLRRSRAAEVFLDRNGELQGKKFLECKGHFLEILSRVVDDGCVLLVIIKLLAEPVMEGAALNKRLLRDPRDFLNEGNGVHPSTLADKLAEFLRDE